MYNLRVQVFWGHARFHLAELLCLTRTFLISDRYGTRKSDTSGSPPFTTPEGVERYMIWFNQIRLLCLLSIHMVSNIVIWSHREKKSIYCIHLLYVSVSVRNDLGLLLFSWS